MSGAAGIQKTGSGTLVLWRQQLHRRNDNRSRCIRLGAIINGTGSGPLGTASAGTIVNSGATFDFGGFKIDLTTSGSLEPLTFSGTGFNGQGALRKTPEVPCRTTASDPPRRCDHCRQHRQLHVQGRDQRFRLQSHARRHGSKAPFGDPTGTGSLTKTGAGSWLLGSASSSFTGGTTIVAGTLKPSNAGTAPNGPSAQPPSASSSVPAKSSISMESA